MRGHPFRLGEQFLEKLGLAEAEHLFIAGLYGIADSLGAREERVAECFVVEDMPEMGV